MRLQCLFTSFQNLSAVSLMAFPRTSVCRFRAFCDRLSCFCVSRLLGLLQPYCCIQGSSSVLYNLLTLRFRVSSSIFSLLCRRPLLSLPIEFSAVCGSVVVATFQLPTDYCRVILVFLPLCLLAFSPYTYLYVVRLAPCLVAFDDANIQPPCRCAMPFGSFFVHIRPVFDLNQLIVGAHSG